MNVVFWLFSWVSYGCLGMDLLCGWIALFWFVYRLCLCGFCLIVVIIC